MNAETQQERRLNIPEQEVPKNLDRMPEAKSWLAMAQSQLARPEAAEWKEGRSWLQGYTGQEVSVAERFIGFTDTKTKRSIMISDGPESDGKHRFTKILVAELPEEESQWLKRDYYLKFIHDEQGNITSFMGADSQKERPELAHAGQTYAEWTVGGGLIHSDIESNGLTQQEARSIMNEVSLEVDKIPVDREFSERARHWSEKTWEHVDAYAKLDQARGSTKEYEKARSKFLQLDTAYRKEFGLPPREEHLKSVQEERKQAADKDKSSQNEANSSTRNENTTIPASMRNDRYFSTIYNEVVAELTNNGKKQVSQEAIDRYVMQVYAQRKAELLRGELKAAA